MRFTAYVTRIDRLALAKGSSSSVCCFRKAANQLALRRQHRRAVPTMTMYRVIDRLHSGRTVGVPAHSGSRP